MGCYLSVFFFFFQAEDGIRDLVRSRGLGDVYKRQVIGPDGYRALPELVGKARQGERAVQTSFDLEEHLSLIHI